MSLLTSAGHRILLQESKPSSQADQRQLRRVQMPALSPRTLRMTLMAGSASSLTLRALASRKAQIPVRYSPHIRGNSQRGACSSPGQGRVPSASDCRDKTWGVWDFTFWSREEQEMFPWVHSLWCAYIERLYCKSCFPT